MTMWSDGMVWRNPPVLARDQGGDLVVVTGVETDCRRETFYGFIHDNGHHLARPGGARFHRWGVLHGSLSGAI